MDRTSLNVVEEFIGENLNAAIIDQLAAGPAEHLIELAYRLGEFWKAFQEERALGNLSTEPYFLPDRRYRWNEVLPLRHYKRLTLYYSKVAVPDPLAGCGNLSFCLADNVIR